MAFYDFVSKVSLNKAMFRSSFINKIHIIAQINVNWINIKVFLNDIKYM